MTLRLTIGIDPGTSGAIAALADGQPVAVLDMPCKSRDQATGRMVDGAKLASLLRGLLMEHRGADVVVVHELVGGFRGQGGASMFAFGQSDGIVRGVVASLGLRTVEVRPQAWKKRYGLVKRKGEPAPGKEASRTLVISLWPNSALPYLRAKDDGRAEAILLALWHEHVDGFATGETDLGQGGQSPSHDPAASRAQAHVCSPVAP